MIRSFKDQGLEKCWREGRCNKVPAKLQHRVLMKLDSMDAATCIEDLRNPPGNHLHTLKGKEFAGLWAISINGPWRLVFRHEEGHIYDIQLLQYH
jgi:proteic killer suppression protein